MIWYDSNTIRTKVLQVKHGLDHWVVYHPPRAGRGAVTVLEGSRSNPPKPILEILKVQHVIQVVSDTMDGKDYFLISVEDPRYWNQIKADVQAVVLLELP